jgi:hypothetical protein
MPFSTGLNTPLSNFEANQNYKDVTDPAGMKKIKPLSIRLRINDSNCEFSIG